MLQQVRQVDRRLETLGIDLQFSPVEFHGRRLPTAAFLDLPQQVVAAGGAWIRGQDTLQQLLGPGKFPADDQDLRGQVEPGINSRDRSASACCSSRNPFRVLLLCQADPSQGGQEGWILRGIAKKTLPLRGGNGELPHFLQGLQQVQAIVGVLGFEKQRPAKDIPGFLKPAAREQRIAQQV